MYACKKQMRTMRSQFVYKPPSFARVERDPNKDETDTLIGFQKSIDTIEATIKNTPDKIVRAELERVLSDLKARRDAMRERIDEESEVKSEESPQKRKITWVQQESVEERMILRWTDELNNIVSRALAPLMRVLGIVAARLRYDDVRPLMVYAADTTIEDRLKVVRPAKTVEEFVEVNRDVGNTLLYAYISTYQPSAEEEQSFKSVDACFDLDTDDTFRTLVTDSASRRVADARKRARMYMERQEMERAFAPAWAFEVMNDAIFRAVLSVTSYGAFEAALAQVRRVPGCASFTLKELVCSPSVSDQFGFLVASTYLASGDDVSGSTRSRGSRHATYMNIMVMRQQLSDSIYTCKIWFESVYATSNQIIKHFELEKQKRLSAFKPKDQETFVDNMLSQFELHKDTAALEKAEQLSLFAERVRASDLDAVIARVRDLALQMDTDPASRMDIGGVYLEFWRQLFSRDAEVRLQQCNAVLKEILEANLDKYKRMLPQRELVYRGG